MTGILVTGACGYVGTQLVARLAGSGRHRIVATDIRRPDDAARVDSVTYLVADVRSSAVQDAMAAHAPDVVVHLASIVTPGAGSSRAFEHSVDVGGTQNVLAACIEHKIRRLVVTSSGAAYGYHPDNPAWLRETDTLRGNPEFPYSDHKRQVEEILAIARASTPALEQVILRVGTILGEPVDNQITRLFAKPRLFGISGSDSPFVFIWDHDLVRILERAATDGPPGIFNVAGDGAMSIDELAATMGKPIHKLPAWLVRAALAVAKPLHLSRYGPEQVRFLQYRPVLDNTRLKTEFGYTPEKTSREVFAHFLKRQAEAGGKA